jgi:hypothetical protein
MNSILVMIGCVLSFPNAESLTLILFWGAPTFSFADSDDYSLARGLRPLGMSFNIGNMAGFSPNLTLQEIPPDPTKNLDQIDDDPAFSWVPRWNNRLVLEAWSLGTFMRLNWWETWMADMKRREDKRLLDEKKEQFWKWAFP